MDKVKQVPLRRCVVSKEKLEKKSLFRILRTPEGEVKIDPTMKANGRGAYLKKDIEVINLAKKSKALDRNLETKVPDEIYDELLELVDKDEN